MDGEQCVYNLRRRPIRIIQRDSSDSSDSADSENEVEMAAPADDADNVENAALNQNLQLAPNMLALSFKPPSFDGSRPDLANRWLNNFNRYADLSAINGENRCTLLGLLMIGGAGTWFDSLDQNIRQNYDLLQAQFRQTYIDVEHTRVERQMATLRRVQQT